MQIGNLHILNPLFLAPMAGVTDHPFRVICRKLGAGVVYTEFVSANGIIRENMKTLEIMKFTNDERPIGIQLFGETPDIVGNAAKIVYDMLKPDIIDINYGCPVPKVTKHGAGSAALKDLSLMEDITRSVVESVPNIPVTVKMRGGWNNNNIISTEAGILMEKIGVAAITLHPRTTQQQFSGQSNWNLIKELKNAINIPVIGNGDIQTVNDYNRMKEETGCDGIMIGRAALGNPWIFKSIQYAELGKSEYIPMITEKINLAKRHFQMLKEYYNERLSVNLSKKHFNYYFKGFDGASCWRKKFMQITTTNEINDLMQKMQKALIPESI